MVVSGSPALPIAHLLLRLMIVLNWLMGAAILVLLFFLPIESWILTELDLDPSPEADRVILGLRAIAVLGLLAIPMHYLILRGLLGIVETVREGEPFVAVNARRLHAIAWLLAGLQILGIVIGTIADAISPSGRPIDVDAGASLTGWLAVLLTFVLARVFAEGAHMRDDIEGTV